MTTTNTCEINGKERTKDVLIEGNINFDSLLLSTNTLEGLKECNYQKPSPIQLKAIPLGRCGFDLVVKSKSGTGKTAVFAVITLEMLNVKKQHLQVLIVAPTREIALQGCDVINSIGSQFKGLKASCFIGGMPVEDDIRKSQGCQIAAGTPGRLKHLILSGHLKTDHLKLFILDEADKLMESSYQSDINEIYHRLPLRKQMLTFSATYPDELDTFLAKYMHTPTHVTAETETPLLLGLKQIVCLVKSSFNVMQQMTIKIDRIIEVLSKVSFTQCLIFSNFQSRAESVSNTLNRKGWSSNFISGNQSQEERIEAIKDLKEFKCKILLSTDLTARGIDASNVDLVINFDVPHDASTYLHRMGRAGRYGSRGICITIAAKGKELTQFEGILGVIGGNSMKVARMPEEIPEKIWEFDFGSFEQVTGKIPEGDFTEESLRLKNIKSSIWELRSSKDTKTEDLNEKNTESLSVEIENGAQSEVRNVYTAKSEVKNVNCTKSEVTNESCAKSEVKNVKAGKSCNVDKLENIESKNVNTTDDILKLLAQGTRPSVNSQKSINKSGDKSNFTRKTISEVDMSKIYNKHSEACRETMVKTNMSTGKIDDNNTDVCGETIAEKNVSFNDGITEENKSTINTIDILKMLSGNQIDESSAFSAAKSIEKDYLVNKVQPQGAGNFNTVDILKMLSGDKTNESSVVSKMLPGNNTNESSYVLNMLLGDNTNKPHVKPIKKCVSKLELQDNFTEESLDTIDVLKMLSGNQTNESVSALQCAAVTKDSSEKKKVIGNDYKNAANHSSNPNHEETRKPTEDSSSKRKRADKIHNQREKKRSVICEKNISLLNITKLLLNEDFCEGKDVTENITSYLDKIRRETSSESEGMEFEDSITMKYKCEEGIEKVKSEESEKVVSEEIEGGDNSEASFLLLDKDNIFLHAYESAVCSSKPHWSKFVDCVEETVEVDEEEEEEKVVNLLNCSDDYEDDSEKVTCYRKNKSSRNRKKSWTKRKNNNFEENSYINNGLSNEFQNTLFNKDPNNGSQNTLVSKHSNNECQNTLFNKGSSNTLCSEFQNTLCKTDVNSLRDSTNELRNNEICYEDPDKSEVVYPSGLYSYHEYGNCTTFDSMFGNCSKVLEEKVNEIEDVESYDGWFLQWQQQVQSVRDYVQQNVYLQEMNRYQYYKTN